MLFLLMVPVFTRKGWGVVPICGDLFLFQLPFTLSHSSSIYLLFFLCVGCVCVFVRACVRAHVRVDKRDEDVHCLIDYITSYIC